VSTTQDDMTTRCEDMISTLIIPRPFDIDRFLAILSETRGRSIQLIPTSPDADLPCGMLISTDVADYIYFVDNVSPLQSQHTVMHEVGHLVFNHGATSDTCDQPPYASGTEALQVLLPNLAPGLVRRILGRTMYACEQEREAELFASLVLARASTSREEYSGIAPGAADDLVRLESAFGHPRSHRWSA
jgi:hypothetical protein